MSNATAKHYTAEVSALWGVSHDMVRRVSGKLPGVLKLGNRTNTNKARKYVTFSIPKKLVLTQHASLAKAVRNA